MPPKPPNQPKGYIPTLDGWRAISILGVMFTHDNLHEFGPLSSKWLFEYGDKGVDVFFAISGILICSRLLDEDSIRGDISLSGFYIRRCFRILPAALAYLLVVACLGAAGVIALSPGEWLGALLLCRNYTRLLGTISLNAGWFTGHFWSLSVEEHFYLILPSVVALLSRRRSLQVLAALALLVEVNRAIQLHSRPWNLIGSHTDTRLDALLIPALLVILIRSYQFSYLTRFLRLWPAMLVLLLIVVPLPPTFWQTTTLVYLTPAVVMGAVLHSNNPLGRVLELKFMRYIGRLSYSLYLWQMLFFTAHRYHASPLGRLERWPLNFVCTFLCAIASHYLIEKPMMRLGYRLAPPETPGREDLRPMRNQPVKVAQ